MDVKFVDRTESSLTLLWEPPKIRGTTNQDVLYDIKCNKCPSRSTSGPCNQLCGRLVTFKPSQNNLMCRNVTIQGLQQDTEYLFVIYSKNENSLSINVTNWARFEMKIETAGRLHLWASFLRFVQERLFAGCAGKTCVKSNLKVL